jgi:hypothetical protein
MGNHIVTDRPQYQTFETAESTTANHHEINLVRQVDQPPTGMPVVRHLCNLRQRTIELCNHAIDDVPDEMVSLRTDPFQLCQRNDIWQGTPMDLPHIDRSNHVALRRVFDCPVQRSLRRLRPIHPNNNRLHQPSIARIGWVSHSGGSVTAPRTTAR